MAFAAPFYDLGPGAAIVICLILGTAIGLINGVLVTILQVPAFIATLTMLLIGRGIVLGLTGGKSILYSAKAREFPLSSISARKRPWIQQPDPDRARGHRDRRLCARQDPLGVRDLRDRRQRAGRELCRDSDPLGEDPGLPPVSLCATIAGLMAIAQDKGATSQAGLSAELIVIASVIIGGASILGGRGRVIGSCLGALVIVLIDKVLREGVPITRDDG